MFIADVPDVVIINGQQFSNALGWEVISDADELILFCSTLDAAKTYEIQVSYEKENPTNWFTLTDSIASVTPPDVVGEAIVYPYTIWPSFRVKASANVASECRWKVRKRWRVI